MPLLCLLLAGQNGGYSYHGRVYDLEVGRGGRRRAKSNLLNNYFSTLYLDRGMQMRHRVEKEELWWTHWIMHLGTLSRLFSWSQDNSPYLRSSKRLWSSCSHPPAQGFSQAKQIGPRRKLNLSLVESTYPGFQSERLIGTWWHVCMGVHAACRAHMPSTWHENAKQRMSCQLLCTSCMRIAAA